MILLDGKLIAEKKLEDLKKETLLLKSKPKLVTISVGENKSSQIYINNKAKAAQRAGIDFEHFHFNSSTTDEVVKKIDSLNRNNNVTSILVQLPLPENIDSRKVLESIDWRKDVDAFTSKNKGLLDTGDATLIPCTALAVNTLLDFYKIDVKGKHVVIVGTSEVVGFPTSKLLLQKGATTTLCNINTTSLQQHTKQADILISATGVKHLIDKKFVKKNSVIINVGIFREEDGQIFGDVNFDSVKKKASALTPTPGGVGPLTVFHLLKNVLICYKILGD